MLRSVIFIIRLFTILYKTDLNELPSTFYIFKEIDKRFHIHGEHCPNCRAKGRLSFHDDYERNLVAYENEDIQENLIDIRRVMCSSCNKTSAVLPDVIVPYKSYSIIFILHVLKAYFFRTETVTALCERFGIAVSTLYAWKKRYLSHKTLNLGKLEKYFHTQDPHLPKPEEICFTELLYSFFQTFGFSFLQYSYAAQSNSS